MKVSKWGNSLAIRIPADVAAKLGITDGDEVEATFALVHDAVAALRHEKLQAAWKALDKVRHQFKRPVDFEFDRDEANSRD